MLLLTLFFFVKLILVVELIVDSTKFELIDENSNTVGARVLGLLIYNGGTVCDDDFSDNSANAICRAMGYSGQISWASYRLSNFRPELEWISTKEEYEIKLDNVRCTQGEWSSCSYTEIDNCKHDEDVFLQCDGVLDGGWTSYSAWTTCSKSCGEGTQTRSRTCTNPSPSNGGASCSGSPSQSQTCITQYCPVNGGWTSYSTWTTCTKPCGNGRQTRSKTCTNPSPAYGGASCSGSPSESQPCNTHNCPVDGGYTDFGSWSECSLFCSEGTRSRVRTCTNPTPQYDGADCLGEASENVPCNHGDCPDAGFQLVGEDNNVITGNDKGLLLYNGGKVCNSLDGTFNKDAANAICRKMGFDSAASGWDQERKTWSIQSRYATVLYDVKCSSNNWSSCFYSNRINSDCTSSHDIFLSCLLSCPGGMYLNYGTCVYCPVNTYKDTEGRNTYCSDCPDGATSMIGSSQCSCEPGMHWSSGQCYECSSGTVSQRGASLCISCPSGYDIVRTSCTCSTGEAWSWSSKELGSCESVSQISSVSQSSVTSLVPVIVSVVLAILCISLVVLVILERRRKSDKMNAGNVAYNRMNDIEKRDDLQNQAIEIKDVRNSDNEAGESVSGVYNTPGPMPTLEEEDDQYTTLDPVERLENQSSSLSQADDDVYSYLEDPKAGPSPGNNIPALPGNNIPEEGIYSVPWKVSAPGEEEGEGEEEDDDVYNTLAHR